MTNLFGHSVRSDLVTFYILEALFVFAAVCLLGVWTSGSAEPLALGDTATLGAVLALSAGVITGAIGLYQPESWPRLGRVLATALLAGLLVLPLAEFIAMALLPARLGWFSLAAPPLAFAAAIALPRLGFAAASRHGLLRRRIVVVGAAQTPGATADPCEAPQARDGFEVAFTVPGGASLEAALTPQRLWARRIWAVVAADVAAVPADLRRRCELAGVRVLDQLEFQEQRLNRVDLDRLPEGWLATARGAEERGLEAALRRALDVAVSLTLVLLTLPLLLVTALAIKLDSPGPVFYRQERVGRGGRVFMLFKFRSMVVDAEAGGAPRWASRHDSRVTRVGRVIRLTRIDEVPQVLNVLRGDMAMVGPRPERPGFVERLGQAIPHYHDRASVKPGITGWAQVNYPYGASVEDARMKLAYDLYYVRQRSLFLDFLILVSTVRVVLFQEGAR